MIFRRRRSGSGYAARIRCLLAALAVVGATLSARAEAPQCATSEADIIATAEDLRAWLQLPHRLVVDIRAAASFNRQHIEGSLNLPAFGIKYDEDLKKKNLLIIAEPHAARTVKGILGQLVDRGFTRPHTLRFGIYTWRALGQTLVPDNSLPVSVTITPQEYLRELASPDTTLFILQSGAQSATPVPEYLDRLAQVVQVSLNSSSAAAGPVSNERCAQNPCAVAAESTDQAIAYAHQNRVTLSPREETGAGKEAAMIRQPLAVIVGGLQGLTEEVERNRAILEQIERDKEPRACR